MNTIGFPKIFNGNSTIVKYGNEATKQSIKLLLRISNGIAKICSCHYNATYRPRKEGND